MTIRERQTPRQKRQVYLSVNVAAALDEAAGEAGLSLGQFIDRLWLEGRTAATRPRGPKAHQIVADEVVFVQHRPESKGWGVICSACGAVKGATAGWMASCPGPK